MIHILIGMAVATVLIILWAQGSLFACVFLSIPPGVVLLLFIKETISRAPPGGPIWPIACVALLLGIWAPRSYRQQRL
jgi:hypothetical protein